MSDNWIILIPDAVEFVPAEEAASMARSGLRYYMPGAESIDMEVSERPQFIDCGSNFERILCPHTGKEIELEGWHKGMGAAEAAGFEDLSFVSPHSGEPTSLANLIYEWPQGFARFSLHALNPNLKEPSRECLIALEEILCCKLKVIWQHY